VSDDVQQHAAHQRTDPGGGRGQRRTRYRERHDHAHGARSRERGHAPQRSRQTVLAAVRQHDDRYQRHRVRDQRQQHVQVRQHAARQRCVRTDAQAVADVVHEQADEAGLERHSARRERALAQR